MDKIYDIETDQKVPVDSKIGKQIIKNYENKLKKLPLVSTKNLYSNFSFVHIYDELISNFYADVSILYYYLQNIKTFKSVGNRIKLNPIKNKRLKSMHFGKKKWANKYDNCVSNTKYPEIYNMLKHIQLEYFPFFNYNQILVNKSQPFKKHKDSNNIKSNTLLFSIGDYTGDLNIEGFEVNTCLTPIIFNGKEVEHSVPYVNGERYSIIYYKV